MNELKAFMKSLLNYLKKILKIDRPLPQNAVETTNEMISSQASTSSAPETAPANTSIHPPSEEISQNLLKDFWTHLTLRTSIHERMLKITNNKLLQAASLESSTSDKIQEELNLAKTAEIDDIFLSLDQVNERIEHKQQAVQLKKAETRAMLVHLREITNNVG